MELILGYVAGLLTLINPCVLPILPVVLASSLQAGRAGPLALAAGMSLSFVALGLGISIAGRSLGLTEESVSNAYTLRGTVKKDGRTAVQTTFTCALVQETT